MASPITINEGEPNSEDAVFVVKQLRAHNAPFSEDVPHKPLNLFARDEEGSVVGGLIGEIAWGWLHIDILWVDERVRGGGVGSDLLTYAENESIAMDSPRAYLETTDFQALGFYQKQGYEVFAELPDQPPGHTCYYLKKELRES